MSYMVQVDDFILTKPPCQDFDFKRKSIHYFSTGGNGDRSIWYSNKQNNLIVCRVNNFKSRLFVTQKIKDVFLNIVQCGAFFH